MFDNFFNWLKNQCNNDETCIVLSLVSIGFLLCILLKDKLTEPFSNLEDISKDLTGGERDKPRPQKKQIGLELNPPDRKSVPPSLQAQMGGKPFPSKLGDSGQMQQPGLNKIDSMIIRPFDEVWNAGSAPSDILFKGATAKPMGPMGPMGPDRPMGDSPSPKVQSAPAVMAGESGSQGELKIVLIYAPWCGHSKKMLPDFEKAKMEFDGKVINNKTIRLVMYNSEVDKDKVKEYGVKGFPTLFVEENGSRSPFPHRSYEKISAYIEGK